jgi:aspartate carbamoyltransferase regulatory subunit
LALVAPDARVAIIRAYSVAEKMTIELGDEVTNVVRCTFSNCITTNPREPLAHRLKVMSREPLELRCHYCGRPQDLEELIHNLL